MDTVKNDLPPLGVRVFFSLLENKFFKGSSIFSQGLDVQVSKLKVKNYPPIQTVWKSTMCMKKSILMM